MQHIFQSRMLYTLKRSQTASFVKKKIEYWKAVRAWQYWSNRHIRHVEEEKPKPKYGALLVTTGGNWVNMELLIEGVADFAFDHMEAECIGSVFAKETDTHPVKENEKAKEKARYLGKRLNELCNRK